MSIPAHGLFCLFSHFSPEDRSVISESEEGILKERERLWNRPTTPNRSPHIHERVRKLSTPGSEVVRDSPHSLTAKNLELHHRRSSSGSSLGRNSPASSIASFELERDRQVEHVRERNWNSPNPKWCISRGSPSPTPSNVSERQRTLSHPTHPTLGSRPRHDSMSPTSSRAASPAFSHSSRASAEEKLEHERERSWNSPRSNLPRRNVFGQFQQGSSGRSPARHRTQSLKNTPSPPSDLPKITRSRLGPSSLSRISPSPPKSPQKAPQLPLPKPDIVVSPSTPPRPLVSSTSKPPFSPPRQPDFSSGWKFPTAVTPDTESDAEPRDNWNSTKQPASLGPHPLDSRIPIRASTSAVKLDDIPKHKGTGTTRHRRSFSELHQANGVIPPRVNVQTLPPPHNFEDALYSM